MMTKAECTCGWSAYSEDRPNARWRARQHRSTIAVSTADLMSLVMLISEHVIPLSLFPALRNLDDAVRTAGNLPAVEVSTADLYPILRQANRPWIYRELPYIPRLIAAVEASDRWNPIGMTDSVKGYCEFLASSHGLEMAEWTRRVTPTLAP
ncbi:hypothetical protein AB0C34_16950 [Nocardia sp. NPDC049220]|uniref:hypothetical protein n=1 Tax=Nocardia sp. NPDC049220 TaxID=3155273 RepID=UPI0033D1B175